jgi:type I restriction-modification system DNA methylase subunit
LTTIANLSKASYTVSGAGELQSFILLAEYDKAVFAVLNAELAKIVAELASLKAKLAKIVAELASLKAKLAVLNADSDISNADSDISIDVLD